MKNKDLYYEPLAYKTQDFQEASLLKSLDQKFTTETNGRSVVFVFSDKEACELILDGYINDELSVNPRDLFNSVHDIKKIIISHKNRNDNNG